MSAATISRPHSTSPPSATVPVPLYTRHTLGAIEAARDRRLQARDRSVHRYTSGDEVGRWVDEGGGLAPERFPVTALAPVAAAS